MNFKKFLSIILVCCMLMSVLSFTACGNKNNGNDNNTNEGSGNDNTNDNTNNQTTDKTYTVTILDGDKNPVEGVKLVITDEKSYLTVTTNVNGQASVQLPETKVSVMVTSVPDGYEKPEKVSGVYHGVFKTGSTDLSITLSKVASNTVTYTVKVIDQNGDAVEGMQVQLCPDGVCLADQFITGANGEISKELTPGKTIDVKLYALDGYTLPSPLSNGYHAVINAGETEVTITVTKN